jgi:hypothetical protein
VIVKCSALSAPVGPQRRKPAFDDQTGDLLHGLGTGRRDGYAGQRGNPTVRIGLGCPRELQVPRSGMDLRLAVLDPVPPVLYLAADDAVSDVRRDVVDTVQQPHRRPDRRARGP